MHNVAIISDFHDWHSDQIDFFLKENNCKILKFTFEELIFSFQKNKIFFENNGFLNNLSGVWVRFIANGTTEEITTKLTILHLLEELNIYIHNSALVIEKTVDKTRTTGLLEIQNVKSPKTHVWFSKNNIHPAIKKNQKYIVKPIFGSQGKNIFLINNLLDLKNIKAVGDIFYLQEFIESEGDKYSDLRVLVSNHQVVSSMERCSSHYITNIFQGAKYKKININKNIQNLSKKISKILKLGYGGIDLKIFNEEIYVLEVNSIPSWKAMQKITKTNISEILVKDFLSNLGK